MVQETKASEMKQTPPSASALRVADLSQNASTPFNLRPETARLKEIAAHLGLQNLRKLSFVGDVTAEGTADWRLTATLGATVVQSCAVTLEPVTTRIDVPVRRLYQRDFEETDAPEVEMTDEETVEVTPKWIDPESILVEALDLNLPLYPRAPGAELGEVIITEPGVAPLRDEDAKPFAGLAALKDHMKVPRDDTKD